MTPLVRGFDEEAFMAFRIRDTLLPAATLEEFPSTSVGYPSSFLHKQARIMGLK